jgi:hypothetical protein
MFQRDPRAGAFLGGDRVSGQDIRDQNGTSGTQVSTFNHLLTPDFSPVTAAQTIANVIKSSLGPMGLDKMLVDNIGVSLPLARTVHICGEIVTTDLLGSDHQQRRRDDTRSARSRAPSWQDFCGSSSEAGQGGRGWDNFRGDHRCGALAPGKRAGQAEDPPDDDHHRVPARV